MGVYGMRVIELDASRWKTVVDFMGALRIAFGAPHEHGWSIDAFVDSMIYGGMNNVVPPYIIQIRGVASAPKEVRDENALLAAALEAGRGRGEAVRVATSK